MARLKVGTRVRVPWGVANYREAVVVELWGDPADPSHIRIELESFDDELEPSVILVKPDWVTPVQAA